MALQKLSLLLLLILLLNKQKTEANVFTCSFDCKICSLHHIKSVICVNCPVLKTSS